MQHMKMNELTLCLEPNFILNPFGRFRREVHEFLGDKKINNLQGGYHSAHIHLPQLVREVLEYRRSLSVVDTE